MGLVTWHYGVSISTSFSSERTPQEVGWISCFVREDQGRRGYLPNVTGAINHPLWGSHDTAVNL